MYIYQLVGIKNVKVMFNILIQTLQYKLHLLLSVECRISQQWLSCNDIRDSVFTSNLIIHYLMRVALMSVFFTAPVEESNNTSAQVY